MGGRVMEVNTIEHVEAGQQPVIDIDRGELERRLARGLIKHKFIVMIDDEEAAGVARDLAEEVLR